MTQYKYPIALTQQFRFCGNPFRVDVYKGCSFGCKYCFSASRFNGSEFSFMTADFSQIEKLFNKAFDIDKESRDINVELLRHKVPLHLGGLSDPFQQAESEYKLTYKLLELTKKYNYPMIMSTKTAHLSDEYWEILDPEIHAFQISIMAYDDDFLRKYETNTPSIKERHSFIKQLKDKGFWVSVRLQPLISLDQAEKVVTAFSPIVDYITVEHLKIPLDNRQVRELFADKLNSDYIKPRYSRHYEVKSSVKLRNILRLKEISKCPIGVGDNDLHEYSDSNCCCGVDTINDNFNGWLKYNYTCWLKGQIPEDTFIPTCSVSSCFNSNTRSKKFNDFKSYVDEYIKNVEIKKGAV